MVSATNNKASFDLTNLNWGGDARLTGGQWALTTRKEEGFQCPDGSTAPTVDTYKFDDVTLTGTHTSLNNAVCGVPAGMKKSSFTLTFAEAVADSRRQVPAGVRAGRQSPLQVSPARR